MSDLTGKFIANTFQKLIQVDSQYGATGSDVAFTQNDLVTTSKYSLLNGLGNKISAIAVESGATGSGIFLKNTTIDPGDAWGISTLQADPFNGNVEVGLSFWRPSPSTSPNLHKLFLKNTGTTWIGYEGLSGGSPGTGIVTDVATYSLYVKDGIQIGQNTAGNNGRINLIGANPLENGAGMFINNEHPMTVRRFQAFDINTQNSRSFFIREFDYSPGDGRLPNADFLCMVVGFEFIRQNDDDGDLSIIKLQAEPNLSTGFWIVDIRMRDNGSSSIDLGQVYVDVLIIKKGLFIVDTSKFTTPYTIDFSGISTPEPI